MPEAVSGCITQSFQVTGGIRTGCCQAQSFAEVLQVFSDLHTPIAAVTAQAHR